MSSFSASATLSGNYDNKEDFREAFNTFDWNHSGRISYSALQVRHEYFIIFITLIGSLENRLMVLLK